MSPAGARPHPRQEELLAGSLKRGASPLSPEERWTLPISCAVFTAVASAMAAFLPWGRTFTWWEVAMVVVVVAFASRTRFVTEAGHTSPIVLATVPALYVLPPAIVPLVTALGYLAGCVPGVLTGRITPARQLVSIANVWFVTGPALVLTLAGSPAPTATPIWILVAALAAQMAVDMVVSGMHEWTMLGMSLRQQVVEASWIYKMDIAFAPVGFMVAIAATFVSWSMLLLIPLLLVMGYFSDERRQRLEQMTELNAAYRGTAMVLGDVVESDDAYTGEHSRGVVQLALEVAEELHLDEQTRRRVDFGAMLHDVGKVAIPKEIINKPGPLDPDEWDIVKTHTTEGQRMLDQVGGLMRNIGLIVRAHHERWDGTGYPDGLRGEEIPIEARIVSACDAWSAMTTTRSYRIAMSREAAMAELQSAAGTQLDPRVVDALIRVIVRNGDHRAAAQR